MSGPAQYLLDTNTLWFIARAAPAGEYFVKKYGLFESPFKPLTSIVNAGEIRAKVASAKSPLGNGFLAAVDKILQEVVIVPLDGEEIVQAYVEVDLACRSRTIGQNDMWVAATAKASGAFLLTTDSDFERLLSNQVIAGEFVDQHNVPALPKTDPGE